MEDDAPPDRHDLAAESLLGESEPGVMTVGELARRLRQATESVSSNDWIEGEASGVRTAQSGHLYFLLKDEREDAVLDAVMYRYQAQRARRFLVEGARIQVRGKATVWAPRGRLQLVVERVRPQGRGALLEALERLKERLQAEGLFDASRKRPLPTDPRVLGVVTSRSGAALHDIITVAQRRGRVQIVLAPALVQGDQAPQSIIRALDLLEQHPDVDLIIVGRGGGSADDLMAFNDEAVVRRVARTRVPVVSAVGHEIDTTLTDLVADRRAATPSQAAEIAVPDRAEREESLRRLGASLVRVMRSRLLEDRNTCARLSAKLVDPRFLIAERQQYLDDLSARLERLARRQLKAARAQSVQIERRLQEQNPRVVIGRANLRLNPMRARIVPAMRLMLNARIAELTTLSARLEALSPLHVLERGYSLTTLASGELVRQASELEAGQRIFVRFHRGSAEAEVQATSDLDRPVKNA